VSGKILLDCYEAVSGARFHAGYFRPGGVYRDLPNAMPKYEYEHSQVPQQERRR
jgi:NADH-quinone oxidoreductase subunit D